MRFVLVVLACWLSHAAQGQPLPSPANSGAVLPEFDNAGPPPADLVCSPAKPSASPRPARAQALAPALEWPDSDDVAAALKEARQEQEAGQPQDAAGAQRPVKALSPARPGWRIAVWGDSHMAAGYFTDEIARLLAPAGTRITTDFLSAGIGHPGVRQAVRRACLSGDWTREHAHAHPAAAQQPAPGLSTLVARQPGATLALDLRDAQGQARARQWDVLYDGASAGGLTLGVRVDGGPEVIVPLEASAGAARLPLRARAPIATLTLRVIEGRWRLQGLQRADSAESFAAPEAPAAPLHLDQFGFPGATVAGWARADLDYLGGWFQRPRYDLVVLAYGTNEANDPNFQEEAYRQMLVRAVAQWRQLQPQAQCVLVAPGDRGVRVARPASRAGRKGGAGRHAPQGSPQSAPKADLLRYARLHALIARIQAEVAASAGCAAWSMQSAMGGPGSAYRWARRQPPLMAPDLIHFTRAGYRELAASFVSDTGLLPR